MYNQSPGQIQQLVPNQQNQPMQQQQPFNYNPDIAQQQIFSQQQSNVNLQQGMQAQNAHYPQIQNLGPNNNGQGQQQSIDNQEDYQKKANKIGDRWKNDAEELGNRFYKSNKSTMDNVKNQVNSVGHKFNNFLQKINKKIAGQKGDESD